MDNNPRQLLDLIRNAATQYGRCCDLYQDSFGQFHCHEDGQRTFAMLRDVQALLGFNKGLGETTEEDRMEARKRAILNKAAPDLLEALEGVLGMAANFIEIHEMKNASKDPDIVKARAAIAKAKGE
ncbi:hypothetical protein [Telmatospirillum sp.]|uniref:hypothetical protein n=1 Tax=Telmatospirillum sp. TaxID=2079197 RepID=UPI002849943E|nr:hypothetical protein [Telmatospirillum sp.]MDR3439849.1 hypothetical protein [Telmatospirillum sp.]